MSKIVTEEILKGFLNSIKSIFCTQNDLNSEISSLKENLNNEISSLKENLNSEISSLKNSQTINTLQVNGSLKIPTNMPANPISGNIWLEL